SRLPIALQLRDEVLNLLQLARHVVLHGAGAAAAGVQDLFVVEKLEKSVDRGLVGLDLLFREGLMRHGRKIIHERLVIDGRIRKECTVDLVCDQIQREALCHIENEALWSPASAEVPAPGGGRLQQLLRTLPGLLRTHPYWRVHPVGEDE